MSFPGIILFILGSGFFVFRFLKLYFETSGTIGRKMKHAVVGTLLKTGGRGDSGLSWNSPITLFLACVANGLFFFLLFAACFF